MKKRSEILYLNVLFCVLVVFIHIISYAVSAFPLGTLKYTVAMIPWRLSSFVVQGFILMAGVKLFLTGKDSVPFCTYIKGRLKRVILPYALCYIGYYLAYVVMFDYPIFDIGFILKHFFLGSLVCHFYFIPLLFQFDLLLPIWKRIVNNVSGIIVIPFALLLSTLFETYFPTMLNIAFPNLNFIYNDRIFTTYLAFWLIGCYIGKNYENFISLLKKNFFAISTIYGFVLVLCTYFSYMSFNGFAYVPFMNLLHFIYAVVAIIFLYAVSIRIPQSLPDKVPLVKGVDKTSFYVYLWHMLVLLFANVVIERLVITSQMTAFIIRVVITYSVTISLCLLYGKIKEKLFTRK